MTIKDFDAIYVIHLSDRPDRLKVILPEFEKIGLRDKIDIRWTCRKNVYKRMADVLPEISISHRYKGNKAIQGGVIGCTLNHYDLIKTSYERGFENIMIFEDDIKFNCDEDIFKLIISHIPQYYKICMLGWVGCNEGMFKLT
jgi:GR25 family glycosyltransferase involved in LPS biosynthesis